MRESPRNSANRSSSISNRAWIVSAITISSMPALRAWQRAAQRCYGIATVCRSTGGIGPGALGARVEAGLRKSRPVGLLGAREDLVLPLARPRAFRGANQSR